MSILAADIASVGSAGATLREPVRTPSLTVVCCVESGPLETTTVLMIESLRRWGGRFANVPVIAVTPRFGPGLSAKTRRRFAEMNVRHVRKTLGGASEKYRWYNFLNKPLSLVIAEAFVTTDLVAWLDADVFVTGSPEGFDLAEGVDFAGCPSDRNLGSTGPGDRYEPYWEKMCGIHGLPLESVPWVQTCREKMRIRLYFNGGILVYRKGTRYAKAYLEGCISALDARVTSKDAGLFFAEQVTAGLIAVKEKLKVRMLPEDCNYAVGSKCEGFDGAAFSQARVLHYHDALWPHFFTQFLAMCRSGKPELYDWVRANGPLANDGTLVKKVWSKMLKSVRGRRMAAFARGCETY